MTPQRNREPGSAFVPKSVSQRTSTPFSKVSDFVHLKKETTAPKLHVPTIDILSIVASGDKRYGRGQVAFNEEIAEIQAMDGRLGGWGWGGEQIRESQKQAWSTALKIESSNELH